MFCQRIIQSHRMHLIIVMQQMHRTAHLKTALQRIVLQKTVHLKTAHLRTALAIVQIVDSY